MTHDHVFPLALARVTGRIYMRRLVSFSEMFSRAKDINKVQLHAANSGAELRHCNVSLQDALWRDFRLQVINKLAIIETEL